MKNSLESSFFDSEYDPSLTSSLTSLLSQSTLNLTQLESLLHQLNHHSPHSSIFSYESRNSADPRFMMRSNESDPYYRVPRMHAVGLTIVLTSPSIPSLFMGTEFFTDTPFTDTPSILDFSFYSNSLSEQYLWFTLPKDLISLRKQYSLSQSELAIMWVNSTTGILTYSLTTSDSSLYIILNTSDQTYNQEFVVVIPVLTSRDESSLLWIPFPETDSPSLWKSVFASESRGYDVHFDDNTEDVEVSKCPAWIPSLNCGLPALHSWSIRIFLSLIV